MQYCKHKTLQYLFRIPQKQGKYIDGTKAKKTNQSPSVLKTAKYDSTYFSS